MKTTVVVIIFLTSILLSFGGSITNFEDGRMMITSWEDPGVVLAKAGLFYVVLSFLSSWGGWVWMPSMIIASIIGSTKGRGFLMFLTSLFLGPLAIFIALAISGNRMRCPSCREKMHVDAKVCPHCRHERVSPISAPAVKPGKKIVLKKRTPDVRFEESSDSSGWQSRKV